MSCLAEEGPNELRQAPADHRPNFTLVVISVGGNSLKDCGILA